MRVKGYNSTSIKDIVEAGSIPKGSFYYYFESKEIFGLELINHYAADLNEALDRCIDASNDMALGALRSFFDELTEGLKEDGYRGGLALGNFVTELADVNEMFRQALKITFDQIVMKMAGVIHRAVENGEVETTLNHSVYARFLFFAWLGICGEMKITHSSETYNAFCKMYLS